MDWDFAGEEDFGLASSFSNAPIGMIGPVIENKVHQNEYSQEQLATESQHEEGIRVDGFNFKLAPGVDVRQFLLTKNYHLI